MSDNAFFDTNVLVYAFSTGDAKSERARELLTHGGVTGVQALNEFVSVARRKLKMAWEEISEALSAIRVLCPSPEPVTVEIHQEARRLAERYAYSIFDSLMIAAALSKRCRVLFSEDMRHGQVIEGIAIRNPFVIR